MATCTTETGEKVYVLKLSQREANLLAAVLWEVNSADGVGPEIEAISNALNDEGADWAAFDGQWREGNLVMTDPEAEPDDDEDDGDSWDDEDLDEEDDE